MSVAADSPTPAPVATALKPPSAFGSVWLPRLVVGAVLLGGWEALVTFAAPAYVAKPSGVAAAIPRVLADPAFWANAGSTLGAVAQGLAIATVLGTVIGLFVGRSRIAERLLRHYVDGFYAVPMVVILPLMSLWFGYTAGARLATVAYAAIFSIIINVADGARSVPAEYLEVSRSYRSSRLRVMLEVVMPAATPYFLAGLKLAGGRALIGAVVAEFFTAIQGLGYFILLNSRTFKHNEAFVAVLALALFGLTLEIAVQWATRRFLPWYRREARTD